MSSKTRTQEVTTNHPDVGAGAGKDSSAGTEGPGPVVLVVDDHPEIRGMVSAVLREAGVGAVQARGPKHALELAAERHFDAAVIGLVMPEVNGLEVLRELRSHPNSADMPAVFLSVLPPGGARDVAIAQILELGNAELLDKPVSPWRLLVALGRLLAAG